MITEVIMLSQKDSILRQHFPFSSIDKGVYVCYNPLERRAHGKE